MTTPPPLLPPKLVTFVSVKETPPPRRSETFCPKLLARLVVVDLFSKAHWRRTHPHPPPLPSLTLPFPSPSPQNAHGHQ